MAQRDRSPPISPPIILPYRLAVLCQGMSLTPSHGIEVTYGNQSPFR